MDSYDLIISKIKKVRFQVRLVKLLEGLSLTITISSLPILLTFLIDRIIQLPSIVRAILLFLISLLTLIVIILHIIIPIFKRFSDEWVALRIEERYPELEDRLISVIQLVKEKPKYYSKVLIEALIRETNEMLSRFYLGAVIDRMRLKRLSISAALSVLIIISYGIFSPLSFSASLERFLNPFKAEPQVLKVEHKPQRHLQPNPQHPVITDIRLRYIYPEYTGLQAKDVNENHGNIEAIIGTRVLIEARANKEIKSGVLRLKDKGCEIPLRIEDGVLRGEILVKGNDTYTINVIDIDNLRNIDPIEYEIVALKDETPKVSILEPGMDIELPKSMVVPLKIKAIDDYGVTSLTLKFSVESRDVKTKPLVLDPSSITHYEWDLGELSLLPGYVVRYWVMAKDEVGNIGSSNRYLIRFPSLYEIYKRVEKEEKEVGFDLERMIEESKEINKEIEETLQDLRRQEGLTYKDEIELKEVLKKKEMLKRKGEEIGKRLRDIIDEMERGDILSEEALRKIEEVRSLLDKVLSEDMKEILKRIQEALQHVNLTDKERSLMDANFREEEFIENLERMIDILKRIQIEQRLEAMIKKVEEMIEVQKRINQETQEKGNLKDLSLRERRLKEELEGLKKDIERLAKDILPYNRETSKRLEEIAKKDIKDILEDMDEVINLLETCATKRHILEKEEEILEGLQQLAKRLKGDLSNFVLACLKGLNKQIERAIYEGLYLSNCQEDINRRMSLDTDLINLAKDESLLYEGMERFGRRIRDIASQTIHIDSRIMRELVEVLIDIKDVEQALVERSVEVAKNEGEEVLYKINKIVRYLLETKENLSSLRSGFGLEEMLQSLKELANRQMEVNKGTRELGERGLDASGERILKQLLYEQELIRRSLQSLSEKAGELSELMKRLDELVDEMKEIEERLESKDVSDLTQRKQKEVLRRLLDAQKSIHREGFSKERRAIRAKEYKREVEPKGLPKELTLIPRNLKRELSHIHKEEFIPEYKELIEKYYKSLSESIFEYSGR